MKIITVEEHFESAKVTQAINQSVGKKSHAKRQQRNAALHANHATNTRNYARCH